MLQNKLFDKSVQTLAQHVTGLVWATWWPPLSHQSVRRRRNSPPCYYERPWTVNGSSHDRSSVEIYNGGKWVSKNCQNSRMIVQRWKTVLWQPQGAMNWKQVLIILLQTTDVKDVKHIESSPRPDQERPSSLDWPSGGGHWAITIILQLWWPLLQSWPLRAFRGELDYSIAWEADHHYNPTSAAALPINPTLLAHSDIHPVVVFVVLVD